MDATTTPMHRERAAPVIETLLQARIQSADPAAWAAFAPAIGGRAEERDGVTTVAFAASTSLAITPGRPGALERVRWGVPDLAPLEAAADRAFPGRERGTDHEPPGADAQPALRLADPDGVLVELVVAAPGHADGSGARLGHVVMGVSSLEESLHFYTRTIGLRVSDRVRIPLAGGARTTGVFLHAADRRHHSLALIDAPPGLRHVMVELAVLDDVGCAYDRFLADGAVRRTLGRHTNDRMVSFYAAGPDGVEIEIGCGGQLVDDASWEVVTHDRPSIWGHHVTGGQRGPQR